MITERLKLRQWKASDFTLFYALNSDAKVMRYFPKLLNREQSDEFATEIQRRIDEQGWGLWAVEELESGAFMGFVGLNRPKTELPFTPCVEVGWRLASQFWGKGYATEAAEKALEHAFLTLQQKEIVSFTAVINKRSQAVMHRLGMSNTGKNFNHPSVDPESELFEHVLYKITATEWQMRQA